MSYKEYMDNVLLEQEVPTDQQLSDQEAAAARLAIERIIKEKYGTDGDPTAQQDRGDEYFGLYKIYVQLSNMLRQKGM